MVPWAFHIAQFLHVGLEPFVPDPTSLLQTVETFQQLPNRSSILIDGVWLHVSTTMNFPV